MSKLKILLFICLAIMVGSAVMAQTALNVSRKITVIADSTGGFNKSETKYEIKYNKVKVMIDDITLTADKVVDVCDIVSHKFTATGNGVFTDGFVTIKATTIKTDVATTLVEFFGNISVTYTAPAVDGNENVAPKTVTVTVSDDCTLTYDYYTAIADVKKIGEVKETTEKPNIGNVIKETPWKDIF